MSLEAEYVNDKDTIIKEVTSFKPQIERQLMLGFH